MNGRSPTETDPRTYITRDALEEAKRLAMPKVASGGGDLPHLAIGLAVALGLGVLTFSQMSAARLKKAEAPPPPEVVAPAPAPASTPIPPRPEPAPFVPAPDSDLEPIQPERLRAPGLVVDYSAADAKPDAATISAA